jgi:GABA(A) receptor-associated protein
MTDKSTKEELDFKRLRSKYPNRLPVIVETAKGLIMPKNKFLCPDDLTVGQFHFTVRRALKLKPHEAIYLFFGGGRIFEASTTMYSVWEEYKSIGWFIKCFVTKESVFG